MNFEGVYEDLVLIGRRFNKVLRKSRLNAKNISFDINKNQDHGGKSRIEEKLIQGKGVRCDECEGFEPIKSECDTYLKKHKKGVFV